MKRRGQRRRQHGNPFNIRGPIDVPDWNAVFGRRAPFALDVGFGAGRFLLELALRHPEWNVLGLEIRAHWVEGIRAAAAGAGGQPRLENLYAMIANASSHLDELLPPESVAFVSVNFPDPWFKNRHQKRRVVRGDWLDLVATKMTAGAELHYVTDYEEAAQEVLALLEDHPRFVRPDGVTGFRDASTTGIQTERELTHQRRGERIYRLMYVRTP